MDKVIEAVGNLLKEEKRKSYEEGLKENIEKLEKTSEKYKSLIWCIRQDGIENILEAMEKEAVNASQCHGIKVVPLHLFLEAVRSRRIKV